VAALHDQMVRRKPKTRDFQKPVVQALERVFFGDALATGYQQRWMYDFWTQTAILERTGFVIPTQQESASTSRIEKWTSFGLDTNPDDSEYNPRVFEHSSNPCHLRIPQRRILCFVPPFAQWLRGPMRAEVEATLLEPMDDSALGLSRAEVRRLWLRHLAGGGPWVAPMGSVRAARVV